MSVIDDWNDQALTVKCPLCFAEVGTMCWVLGYKGTPFVGALARHANQCHGVRYVKAQALIKADQAEALGDTI